MQSAQTGPNPISFINRLQENYTAYSDWLRSQTSPTHLKRAQRSRLSQFIGFVQRSSTNYQADEPVELKDKAANDYIDYLQYFLKARPSTINKALATINHFYEYSGIAPITLNRVDLPTMQPQALSAPDLERYLHTANSCASIKHRAVALLLGTTGIRVSECIALDLDDYDDQSSSITVKQSDLEAARVLPLDKRTDAAIGAWLELRKLRFNRANENALFLNPQRRRMSQAGVNLVVRKVSQEAKLALTAQHLRDTFLVHAVSDDSVEAASRARFENMRAAIGNNR